MRKLRRSEMQTTISPSLCLTLDLKLYSTRHNILCLMIKDRYAPISKGTVVVRTNILSPCHTIAVGLQAALQPPVSGTRPSLAKHEDHSCLGTYYILFRTTHRNDSCRYRSWIRPFNKSNSQQRANTARARRIRVTRRGGVLFSYAWLVV